MGNIYFKRLCLIIFLLLGKCFKNKLFLKNIIILFSFLTLSACEVNKDIKTVSKDIVNKANNFLNILKIDKNEGIKKNKSKFIKDNMVEFIEWECRKYFGFKNILKVGYFPTTITKGISFGALILQTNNKIDPAIHRIEGIDETFSWGGEELIKYKLVIKSNNTAYYFDFSNTQKNKEIEYNYMLKCSKKRYDLGKKDVDNYLKRFTKFSKKFNINIPEFK